MVKAVSGTHAKDNSSDIQNMSHLFDIAIARSGDKGTSANIGVIVRRRECWELLRSWLSANLVAAHFAPLGIESVDRFELPNLGALNFVLHGVLRRNLRTDAQGKALGQMLLELPLPENAKPSIQAMYRLGNDKDVGTSPGRND
jgi:hypothetical protein